MLIPDNPSQTLPTSSTAREARIAELEQLVTKLRVEREQLLLLAEQLRESEERYRTLESETGRLLILERCVAGISRDLLALPWNDMTQGICDGLAIIGAFAQADRSYLFTVDHEQQTISVAHEWCAAGIVSWRDRVQQAPFAKRQWAMERLLRNEVLYIPQVSSLPPEAADVKAEFTFQSIQSLLQVPLYLNERLIGILGFDAVRAERAWHEADTTLLTMVGELFVHALDRQRVGEERLELQCTLLEAQKRESLGLLAGGIAHDFNNMLAVILGNAELALEELPADSPIKALLTPLASTTRHAADLTRQLLAYAGRGRFIVEQLDLNAVIREMQPLLYASVPRTVTLQLDLAPSLPVITGDATQIHQVILNLVINGAEAIGATGNQGIVRVVTAITQQAAGKWQNGFITLEISDSGCGMDAATQARIFEPFFTTKFTGRGLGLAAVHGIVNSHNGDMQVSSSPGTGTIFGIRFPATTDTASVALPTVIDTGSPTAAWHGNGVVLVIDDEDGVRLVVRRMLERLGFSVLLAADGQRALTALQDGAQVRCALLDLTMPQLSGQDTFHELRRLNASLPIVMMSGFAEEEVLNQFRGQQISGFLHKPFSPQDLQAVLQRTLQD